MRRRLPNITGNLRGPSGTQMQQHTSSDLLVSTEAKLGIEETMFSIKSGPQKSKKLPECNSAIMTEC